MLYIIFARVGVSTLMVVFLLLLLELLMLRIFSRSSGKYHFCTRALSNPYVCHVALYADQYQLYPATCRGKVQTTTR